MIIIIVLALCVFISWVLIPHKVTRYILGSLSTLALVLVIIAITANMTHHWGMEKQTTTSDKKEIYSAGNSKSPTNMLIANEVGKKSNNYVMVYKEDKNDKKPEAHFKPKTSKSDLSDSVKKQVTYKVKDVDKATVQTKKTVWVWKSKWYERLLEFGNENNQLIKSKTTVTVPKDTWIVLNSDQVKKLQKMQKQNQNSNQQKQQAQKMQMLAQKYKQQHPNASQKEVQQHVKKEQQIMATKQLKEELK